jgi:hypothetical protein
MFLGTNNLEVTFSQFLAISSLFLFIFKVKVKGKDIPVTGRGGP